MDMVEQMRTCLILSLTKTENNNLYQKHVKLFFHWPNKSKLMLWQDKYHQRIMHGGTLRMKDLVFRNTEANWTSAINIMIKLH